MSFSDSLDDVARQMTRQKSVRATDVAEQEQDRMLRKYFPEVQQALASGLGDAGFKVVVNPDPNAPAHVDLNNKIIQVPSIGDGNYDRIQLARGFIDHELGHVRYTERSKVRAPKGDNLYQSLVQVFEDMRIDRQTCKDWPGSQLNLSETFQILKPKMREGHDALPKELQDLYEFFENAYSSGALDLPTDIKDDNLFKELLDPYVNRDYKSTSDVRHVMNDLCNDIRKIVKDLDTPPPPPDGEGDEEGDGDGGGEGDGKGKGKSKKPKDDKSEKGDGDSEGKGDGESKGEGGEGDDDSSEPDGGEGKGDAEPEDKSGSGAGEDSESDGEDDGTEKDAANQSRDAHDADVADQGEKLHRTPKGELKTKPMSVDDFNSYLGKVKMDMSDMIKNEFGTEDYKPIDIYTRYLEDDLEITPEALRNTPRVDAALQDLAKVQGHLMSQFIRMYKQERPLPKRRQNRGSLDIPNIYRAFVNDEDLFIRKLKQTAFNISYSLLIDLSGSMYGKKLVTAFQSALVVAKVLDTLRIPCEILGFTTEDFSSPDRKDPITKKDFRRTIPLRHYIFKKFDERVNWITFGRIEWLLESGCTCHNVDGEGVEWAGNRLINRKETQKVLIVLSDGMPEDGKGSGLLSTHLMSVVKELTKKSIICIGLGIHTSAVKSFYKDYAVLKDIEELPKILLTKVEQKLGGH